MAKTIISIDPGYDRIGVAIVEKKNGGDHVVFSTCIQTDKNQDLADRLFALGQELDSIIKQYTPDTLAIENVFFTSNQKTVIGVAEAKGVIKYIAKTHQLEVQEYTPLQIKSALTGYGKATKDQVQFMVGQITKLDLAGKIDDEVDAIAVGITALAHAKA